MVEHIHQPMGGMRVNDCPDALLIAALSVLLLILIGV